MKYYFRNRNLFAMGADNWHVYTALDQASPWKKIARLSGKKSPLQLFSFSKERNSQCLKITRMISFYNIASEASLFEWTYKWDFLGRFQNNVKCSNFMD